MKFATHYTPNKNTPEKNSGKKMIEKIGYIPAQKRIENLLLAGQRLKDFRESQFDFPDEESIDHDFFDPTRAKNFDLADASQMQYDITGRLNRSQTSTEASQTSTEASEELKTVSTDKDEVKTE